MSIFIVNSLDSIWCDRSEQNDYACLSDVNGEHGVYIFRDPKNGDALYVGESREQDLKTRVKQNFTENDTGGTFRKNFMKSESQQFSDFKEFLNGKQLILLTLDKSMIITALESILIFSLQPIFNRNK